MNTEILEQVGLSKNEIKAYFALLELDQSSATPIVKKAGIPNSKVYPILDKLISKGLVSFVIKNNVKYFQASDPRNLIEIIRTKEKQLSSQKREIEDIIPQIETRKKMAKEKQESTIYEGLAGVKVAFNELLNSLEGGEEYLAFSLGEELGTRQLNLFFTNFHRKRIEKCIKVRIIVKRDIRQMFSAHHLYKGMAVKYTGLRLPTGIFIFKNKVMTIVWKDNPTAFVITSKNNYERYREFFEEMWKMATP